MYLEEGGNHQEKGKMPERVLRYVIGVDLGGTKIELGIVDETGRIHQHQRLETLMEEGAPAIEEQVLNSIHLLQEKAGIRALGIGIGVAGQIQPKTGLVIFAPNLKWHNVPLQANIETALKIPVCIVNDVRAITLGEWLYGAGKGYKDLVCVFVGTGIGTGVVSGGQLLTGCSNTFGEAGHMTIDFNGPVCTCGKLGCWEAFAGGWGIAAQAQKAIEADGYGAASQYMLKLAGDKLYAVTAKIVADAYHHSDPLAVALMEKIQKALIAGFASLVNVYNPCRLIIGGGLIDGMPELIQMIDKGVKDIALKAATQSLETVKANLGKEVGVIGAAAAIFNLIEQERIV
jgi:glucokinase